MNVLVIDDDPVDLLEIERAFERLGGDSTVFAAESAAGLEMIGDNRPDLLLLDWLMPGKSGIDILMELEHRPRTYRPGYVVMMTAAPDIDLLRAIALEIGADEVVSKRRTFAPESMPLGSEVTSGAGRLCSKRSALTYRQMAHHGMGRERAICRCVHQPG